MAKRVWFIFIVTAFSAAVSAQNGSGKIYFSGIVYNPPCEVDLNHLNDVHPVRQKSDNCVPVGSVEQKPVFSSTSQYHEQVGNTLVITYK